MRGELRRHVGLDFLDLGIRVRAREIAEDVFNALERLPGALHRHERVLERRRIFAVRDRFDFLDVLGQRGGVSRREVLVLDLVERRILVGQRALDEQRIVTRRGCVRGLLCRRTRGGCGGVHRGGEKSSRARRTPTVTVAA